LDKLEKTLKKASHKPKKRRRDNSDSDSKQEIWLGSTRKLGFNLEKAVKPSKFTPPSPIEATPSELANKIAMLLAIGKSLAIGTLLAQQHLAIKQSFTILQYLAIQQCLVIQQHLAILQCLAMLMTSC
jgi:hypothetical protein